MSEDTVLKFEVDVETGKPIPFPITRFAMSAGGILRLYLYPDGLRALIEKSSLENGDIITLAELPPVLGFKLK